MTPATMAIVGHTLTKLLRTDWGRPHDVLPGIHPFYYYSVVVEIDGVERFELSHDGLRPWEPGEKLYPVNPAEHGADPQIKVVGEKVAAVRTDEVGIVTLILVNNVEICVAPDSGTCLYLTASSNEVD